MKKRWLNRLQEVADAARERCSKYSHREKYRLLMQFCLQRQDYLQAAEYRDLMRQEK